MSSSQDYLKSSSDSSSDERTLRDTVETILEEPRLPKARFIRKPEAWVAAWNHPPTVYVPHRQNYLLVDWRLLEGTPELTYRNRPWVKYLTKDVKVSDKKLLSRFSSYPLCIEKMPWPVAPWLPYHDLVAQRVTRNYYERGFPMCSDSINRCMINSHIPARGFDVSKFFSPQAWRKITYKRGMMIDAESEKVILPPKRRGPPKDKQAHGPPKDKQAHEKKTPMPNECAAFKNWLARIKQEYKEKHRFNIVGVENLLKGDMDIPLFGSKTRLAPIQKESEFNFFDNFIELLQSTEAFELDDHEVSERSKRRIEVPSTPEKEDSRTPPICGEGNEFVVWLSQAKKQLKLKPHKHIPEDSKAVCACSNRILEDNPEDDDFLTVDSMIEHLSIDSLKFSSRASTLNLFSLEY